MEARTISFWRSSLTLFSCESLLFEVLAQNQKSFGARPFSTKNFEPSALDRLKTIRHRLRVTGQRSNKVIHISINLKEQYACEKASKLGVVVKLDQKRE